MGTINRNAPCPCGSGKKYKNCCLVSSPAATVTAPGTLADIGGTDWSKTSRGRDQDNEIDRHIIQGYDQLQKQDHQAACEAWARVWDQLLLRLSPDMTSCEETLSVYDGSYYLADWIQDYCSEMHNLALTDTAAAQAGAAFCSQVLLQFPQESDLLRENFRASLGEFHFLAGQPDEGEKVLTELIADLPHHSVGYAYLADMYGEVRFNSGQDQPRDLDRAIKLLEQGLAYPVEDAQDYDLERRLGWFREAKEKQNEGPN